MILRKAMAPSLIGKVKGLICSYVVRWFALLGLCAAYLQGGLTKAFYFDAAVAEMNRFGLSPAAPLAFVVICLEIGASMLVLTGFYRWIGAMVLGGFTFVANLVANRFWNLPPPGYFVTENAFFEHLGLVGGFLLVAWHDLRTRGDEQRH
jgi:uncharacterized membrane protein YphA (DoxX/SURF4 family)